MTVALKFQRQTQLQALVRLGALRPRRAFEVPRGNAQPADSSRSRAVNAHQFADRGNATRPARSM